MDTLKFSFKKEAPYKFKDLTGLDEIDQTGYELHEDGKMIGGIKFDEAELPMFDTWVKGIGLAAIEILPEFRSQGKGTELIKQFLSQYSFIVAGVQEERAWDWWKKLGGLEYLAMLYPEDVGKPNPRTHTIAFVVGKTPIETAMLKMFFRYHSANDVVIEGEPKIDFSINKKPC